MAARATALVLAAQEAGQLPPELDPDDLDRASKLPNLTRAELKGLLGLYHLSRCVEVRFTHHPCSPLHLEILPDERWPQDRVPPPPLGTPEPPEHMAEWRERLHAAIYTSLFMGAALARAYNEPFFPNEITSVDPLAEERRLNLLQTFDKWHRSKTDEFNLSPSHCEYLSRFPAYHLNLAGDSPGVEGPFGSLERWLINSAIAEACARPIPARFLARPEDRYYARFLEYDPQEGIRWVVPWQRELSELFAEEPAHVAAGALWVVLQSIHMFEFLLTCFENVNGEEGQGRPESAHGYGDFVPEIKNTAHVVLFGVFRVEKVSMLKKGGESATRPFRAQTVKSSAAQDGFPPDELDIPAILEALHLRSGVSNHQGPKGMNFLIPPPPLQFFVFLLSKQFGLTIYFPPNDEMVVLNHYVMFTSSAAIFANQGLNTPGRGEWLEEFDCGALLTDTAQLGEGIRVFFFDRIEDNPRYYPPYDRYGDSSYDGSEESQDSYDGSEESQDSHSQCVLGPDLLPSDFPYQ
ncbi:hypothetical protein QBC34DRAFT_214501 [Podospora aff. communis PSN243]|uniref:Uncharacterized protein n=1 Tax=Podospora aff. communis PSN243 TaxID=3040156 RepID=A0AAV9G4I7_9PEZI|nr:hypothetical protein QBC34DRAFT_214501 [Podospora aff. communis PSN243]